MPAEGWAGEEVLAFRGGRCGVAFRGVEHGAQAHWGQRSFMGRGDKPAVECFFPARPAPWEQNHSSWRAGLNPGASVGSPGEFRGDQGAEGRDGPKEPWNPCPGKRKGRAGRDKGIGSRNVGIWAYSGQHSRRGWWPLRLSLGGDAGIVQHGRLLGTADGG